MYDSGAVVDLSLYDVNLVAELLLAYFRDLPEQVIPNDVDEVGKNFSLEFSLATEILR